MVINVLLPTFWVWNSLKLHEISFRVLTIIILFIQNKLKDKDSFYVLKLGKNKNRCTKHRFFIN